MNGRRWLWLLPLWPLVGALAMAGCVRRVPEVYTDANGCQYLRGYFGTLTARTAPDGKTHLGCKGGTR